MLICRCYSEISFRSYVIMNPLCTQMSIFVFLMLIRSFSGSRTVKSVSHCMILLCSIGYNMKKRMKRDFMQSHLNKDDFFYRVADFLSVCLIWLWISFALAVAPSFTHVLFISMHHRRRKKKHIKYASANIDALRNYGLFVVNTKKLMIKL